jgi:hypothetical protein
MNMKTKYEKRKFVGRVYASAVKKIGSNNMDSDNNEAGSG